MVPCATDWLQAEHGTLPDFLSFSGKVLQQMSFLSRREPNKQAVCPRKTLGLILAILPRFGNSPRSKDCFIVRSLESAGLHGPELLGCFDTFQWRSLVPLVFIFLSESCFLPFLSSSHTALTSLFCHCFLLLLTSFFHFPFLHFYLLFVEFKMY